MSEGPVYDIIVVGELVRELIVQVIFQFVSRGQLFLYGAQEVLFSPRGVSVVERFIF